MFVQEARGVVTSIFDIGAARLVVSNYLSAT